MLPERGLVKLTIEQSFEIRVTAEEARHQVDTWLFDQVSYMMTADAPMLVLGARIVWRVPVLLTASHIGLVGQVGTVDIDIQTGQIADAPDHIAELQQAGLDLGERLPLRQSGRKLPDEAWATTMQPTYPRKQNVVKIPAEMAKTA